MSSLFVVSARMLKSAVNKSFLPTVWNRPVEDAILGAYLRRVTTLVDS